MKAFLFKIDADIVRFWFDGVRVHADTAAVGYGDFTRDVRVVPVKRRDFKRAMAKAMAGDTYAAWAWVSRRYDKRCRRLDGKFRRDFSGGIAGITD